MTQRLVGPDLSRGVMLLLIAAMNITAWLDAQAFAPERRDGATGVYLLVRGLFIDDRVLPLFALLVGLGAAVIVERESGTSRALGQKAHPVGRSRAVRHLAKRGSVLVGIGALSAALHPYEILGTYGLVLMLLGWLVARSGSRSKGGTERVLVVVGTASLVVTTLFGLAVVSSFVDESTTLQSSGMTGLGLGERWAFWLINSLSAVALGPAVSCAVLGYLLWSWGPSRRMIKDPSAHRGALWAVGSVGLVVGGPGWALLVAAMDAPLDAPVATGFALMAGLGWLALLLVLASFGGLVAGRAGSALVATGRRSLSAYCSQALIFWAAFVLLDGLGLWESVGELAGAGIALGTWALSVVGCAWLEHRGWRGPLETALRRFAGGSRASASGPRSSRRSSAV